MSLYLTADGNMTHWLILFSLVLNRKALNKKYSFNRVQD